MTEQKITMTMEQVEQEMEEYRRIFDVVRLIEEETIQMMNNIPSNDITIPFNLDNSIAQSGIKVKSHLTTPTELSIRNRTPSSSLYFSE